MAKISGKTKSIQFKVSVYIAFESTGRTELILFRFTQYPVSQYLILGDSIPAGSRWGDQVRIR